MKKILVPTDFSGHAENAVKVAAELAKKFQAEIYLLHIIELPVNMVNPVGEMRNNDLPEALFFMKMAKKKFGELRSRSYLQKLEVKEVVEFDQAFEGIIDTAKKHGCDFIVMGSQGASGFKEIFIGSNTEKVVRTSDIPVLVVKESQRDLNFRKVIFATNLDPEGKKTLPKVIDFANHLEAELQLVYINTANEFLSSEEIDNLLAQYLEGMNVKVDFQVYNADSIEKGIMTFAKRQQADLVAIATHGRRGLAHFFNGSITEDLANHANVPVVTFRFEK